MNFAVGARTDVGRIREANEDAYLVDSPLFAVADGMGGHIAGDVASSTAVEVIKSRAGSVSPEDKDTLASLVKSANRAIWEKAQSDPNLRGMGTTCTLVMLDGNNAYFAHVGDSRAYLLRNEQLQQLTRDHSLVGRMVEEGRLTEEEAEHHPQRSIITRALGVDSDVDVDLFSIDVVPGDRLLICSDGLSSMTSPSAIRDVLSSEPDPQAAADRLVSVANEAGGEDNITVVVLDFTDDGEPVTRQQRTVPSTAPPPPSASPSATARSYQSGSGATGVYSAPAATAVTEIPEPVERFETALAQEREARPPRRRIWRRVAVGLVVLLVVIGVAYAGARFALNNSFYVGVNDDGRVTIFKGRPEEIAWVSLHSEQEVTNVAVDDLPAYLQSSVEEGIVENTLADAQETVDNLRVQATENEAPEPQEPGRRQNNDQRG